VKDKFETELGGFSDGLIGMIPGKQIKSFSITANKPEWSENVFKKRREGGFFNHQHNINNQQVIDILKQLQIYQIGFVPDDPNTCFIEAIKDCIPETLLTKLKTQVRDEVVSLPTIRKVAENNNMRIEIKLDQGWDVEKFGKADAEHYVKICKVGTHYYKYIENTGITSFFLNNYDDLCDKEDGHLFYTLTKRAKARFIDSFKLVNIIMKNQSKFLRPVSIEVINAFKGVKMDVEKVYDYNIDNCVREIVNPNNEEKQKPEQPPLNIYFDIETQPNKHGKHIPYLCCYVDDNDFQKSFEGPRCLEDMLKHLAMKHGGQNVKKAYRLNLFAHNSTFDSSFLLRYLLNLQVLEKDGKYVNVKGNFCHWERRKWITLVIKDSWRIIPMSLAKMPQSLGFGDQAMKEILYYEMFNYQTIDHIKNMTKEEMEGYINKFDEGCLDKNKALSNRTQFYKNWNDWDCVNENGTYDLMKYSKIYCENDCKVLKLGMQKWKALWQEIDSRINIYDFHSLPSLADYYFRVNGCQDGCYQLAGCLGQFFSELCARWQSYVCK
jgi:hypothetical protein